MTGAARTPAVAGIFYPGEAPALLRTVTELLNRASAREIRPVAIVAPHAGFTYSGPIAASAYAALHPIAADIRHVLLLGPSHRVSFEGAAVPSVALFSSPLGQVPLNRSAMDLLRRLPFISERDDAHDREHSLEVQLPFLQVVLHNFTLTPVSVGTIAPANAAEIIRPFLGRPNTLVVISTDLSHYHDYAAARALDGTTAKAILQLAFERIHSQDACGCHGLNGMLFLARELGMMAVPLDVRNSGDTAGDHARVVGYGAFAFVPGGIDRA